MKQCGACGTWLPNETEINVERFMADYCLLCLNPLHDGSVIIGMGDGRGEKFAHKQCYDNLLAT